MSTYNNEFYQVNSQRAYPFKRSLDLLPDDLFLDMRVYTPFLPAYVTKISLTDKTFVLVLKGEQGNLIGTFCFQGEPRIELTSTGTGCSGVLVCDVSKVDQFLEEKAYEFFSKEISIMVELRACKFIPEYKIPSLKIGEEPVSGDILLESNSFLDLVVEQIDPVTSKVVFSTPISYLPKCAKQVPLLTINGVGPDENKLIYVESNNEALLPSLREDSIIEIRSKYDLEDFQKFRRLGPRGLSGPIGGRGLTGLDGQQIQDNCSGGTGGANPVIESIAGFQMPSSTIFFSPLDRVAVYNESIIGVVKSGTTGNAFLVTGIDVIPKKNNFILLPTIINTNHNDCTFYEGSFLVCFDGGIIQKYDLLGNFLETLSFPNEENILRIDSSNNNLLVVTTSDVYVYDGVTFNPLEVPSFGIIENARWVDEEVFVCYTGGKGYNVATSFFYNFGVEDTTTDRYGEWVTTSNGKLIKIHPDNSFSFTEVANGRRLSSIDGFGVDFAVVVGDNCLLSYDGVVWSQQSVLSRSWKDVAVISPDLVYFFG